MLTLIPVTFPSLHVAIAVVQRMDIFCNDGDAIDDNIENVPEHHVAAFAEAMASREPAGTTLAATAQMWDMAVELLEISAEAAGENLRCSSRTMRGVWKLAQKEYLDAIAAIRAASPATES